MREAGDAENAAERSVMRASVRSATSLRAEGRCARPDAAPWSPPHRAGRRARRAGRAKSGRTCRLPAEMRYCERIVVGEAIA